MLRSLVGSEMCIRDSGMFMDPQYGYAVKESPFVPVDGEMFWHIGHQKYDQNWPMVIGAETAAWRLREMHYSTLSLVHGFTKLDGVSKAELGNETIDSWMSAPLNLTLLQNSRLPISDAYTQVPHTGYEYIRDHLGYRLELQAATFPSIVSIPTGQSFALPFSARLINFGFAAPVNPRPVWLVLLTGDNSSVSWKSQDSVADPRDWQPFAPGDPTFTPLLHVLGVGTVEMVRARFEVASDDVGLDSRLAVGLLLPDARSAAAAYSVRFANDDVDWLHVEGEGIVNVIGSIVASNQQSVTRD
eukprot:TRINITY_DN5230_c0_g2_i2.p1 TRINITY_DN5230_c0_g2~~TRINITY_DN5230_c0_g2_i2.p1  ORF type:complete len:301 (-),score=60.33 TRINITY_DN5230_c0_g2_i2:115-1017(-)